MWLLVPISFLNMWLLVQISLLPVQISLQATSYGIDKIF